MAQARFEGVDSVYDDTGSHFLVTPLDTDLNPVAWFSVEIQDDGSYTVTATVPEGVEVGLKVDRRDPEYIAGL